MDAHLPRVVKPYPTNPEQCLFFYARDTIEVYNYASEKQSVSPASVIVGPQLARVNLSMGYDQLTIKVGFQAGGLFRLLGVPMWHLQDQTLDSYQLLGREIREVNEQLREINDYPLMIKRVERFLLGKAAKLKSDAHPVDKVAQYIQQHATKRFSLGWLASQACLSPRQFERKCLERIGMSPKLFLRVVRFAQAYRLKERQPELDWQDIVYKCGYYDQMHLIRDFKLFANVTPTKLMKEEAASSLKIHAGNPF